MARGRVYVWVEDDALPLHSRVAQAIVPLPRLEPLDHVRLSGLYVTVRNGGTSNVPVPGTPKTRVVAIGDAQPDAGGDFLFEPGMGGGRLDKAELPDAGFLERYLHASHFGEVNTYYHLDRIAAYVDSLLCELDAPSLPRVTAVVTAHNSGTDVENGVRDGLRRDGRWVAFQGGHYRLPSKRHDPLEREPISPHGEIHLGAGRQITTHGALAHVAGRRYRANASHNAGIIYHEYGHHISRHTADFCVNDERKPDRQSNRKPALDEAIADYWAATMLATPHIWALHHRHDAQSIHARSLASEKTMAEFDSSATADAHLNGTIWAAAMWNVRSRLLEFDAEGARHADLILLQAMLLLGKSTVDDGEDLASLRARRPDFSIALSALLDADQMLYAGRHQDILSTSFANRGIAPRASVALEKI